VQYQRAESPLTIHGLSAARSFFAGCLAEVDPTRESLWVAHLDPQLRCLHVSQHDGDTTGVDFPLRSIIVDAAQHQSAAVVLAHNHPSGDPTPSETDLRATRHLAAAAGALGCEVADHLIFAGTDCTSLRSLGYL
jgi:DNA repair protein RadC